MAKTKKVELDLMFESARFRELYEDSIIALFKKIFSGAEYTNKAILSIKVKEVNDGPAYSISSVREGSKHLHKARQTFSKDGDKFLTSLIRDMFRSLNELDRDFYSISNISLSGDDNDFAISSYDTKRTNKKIIKMIHIIEDSFSEMIINIGDRIENGEKVKFKKENIPFDPYFIQSLYYAMMSGALMFAFIGNRFICLDPFSSIPISDFFYLPEKKDISTIGEELIYKMYEAYLKTLD